MLRWRRLRSSHRSRSRGARRSGAEEGVLEDAHVGGDRGVGPRGAGRRLRVRRAVEGLVGVARVGHGGMLLVRVDRRGPRDGRGDGGRADPLQAHGRRLGLRRRWVRAVLVLRGRRRRRGRAGGELLDHVPELVLADVVDLRLRRAGRGLLLGRRGRGLPDGAAELVDPEVRVLAGGRGAAAAARGAIHGALDQDQEEPEPVGSVNSTQQGGGGHGRRSGGWKKLDGGERGHERGGAQVATGK
jgi:hypothetical protein